MIKKKTLFICQSCGATAPKWLGKCPDCGRFNTYAEEQIHREQEKSRWIFSSQKPQLISQVKVDEDQRLSTGMSELDRVLGGGIVAGSMVLVGGEPGIGKSTLLLQAAGNLAAAGHTVLLVSGEESIQQIKMRAQRLGAVIDNLYLVSEIAVDRIKKRLEETAPKFLIIDSIQTLYDPEITSAPGSVSQVRSCTGELMRLAKTLGIPVFIVGHVTKNGAIAGPRILEHMVDTVLYFEGGDHNAYRLVRATKNRYGATNELAVFEMKENGLNSVANPSARLLAERSAEAAGSVVVAVMEGTRPMLVELQSLVSDSYLAVPRRLAGGVDYNRALLTLAVLEKRAGIHLERRDVYLNVAGGIKVTEPAVDLGLALATASAHLERPVGASTVVFGEVGLSGEIRYVSRVEARVKEAVELGFERLIMPSQALEGVEVPPAVEVCAVKTLSEAVKILS